MRVQRGEGIVGNLGTGIGDRANERRLARVRHAEQSHVGQHPEFELQLPLFPRLALGELARRAIGTRLEVQVAETAATTGDSSTGWSGSISSATTLHRCPRRTPRFPPAFAADVGAASAVADRRRGQAPAHRPMSPRVAVVDQRVDVAIGPRPHAAAAPAIAAVRPSLGNEFFATKRGTAIPTLAGGDFNACFVDELHRLTNKKALPRTAGLRSNRTPPRGSQPAG